jgi:hypothetical protein
MPISPTAEGFRAAFRRPSLTLAEIAWRWIAGATAIATALFGLSEYLNTLPVTSRDLLFLRTRQPYLVAEAIAHIFRGSLSRVAIAGMVASLLLAVLWIVAGSFGRFATVRGLIDYFRGATGPASARGTDSSTTDAEQDAASSASTSVAGLSPLRSLIGLNFLRVAVALASIFGIMGSSILAGFASPAANPQPGLAFMLFLPLAALVGLAWSVLNWLLSLAGMFAVRDGNDAVGAISAAVKFFREHLGAVFAVSSWTGLAHLVAFVAASTVGSMPLGFVAIIPWRLVVAAMIVVSLLYFALADWLYMARLAGYVCIAEMPEASLVAKAPAPPYLPPSAAPGVRTTIDRDEPILSDVSTPLVSG